MSALWGVLAEFEEPAALARAVRRARAAGYRRLEAYTPFPLEEVDQALELPAPRAVALITLAGGLLGAAGGYLLQYYVMAVDYPINVGGRPLQSWPAFIPVTFELMVLCAALAATIGLFALNRWPELHHPLFAMAEFERLSEGALFLAIRADDPRFDLVSVRQLLNEVARGRVRDVPAS